jgi:hypothetical protein
MRLRTGRYAGIDGIIRKWQVQEEGLGHRLTGPLLVAKARTVAEALNVNFPGSNGWFGGFKRRYGLKLCHFHGEAQSVNFEHVVDARARIQTLLKGYNPRDIYNMDETGLFYRMPPDKGLASQQTAGVKGDKTRITLAFCVNADGSDIREPLFIGHARRPRCFDKKDGYDLGFDYYWNKKAWMTGILFQL